MIDFSELALSPNESRAARNFLGLSQTQAAEQSNLPAHKLKRFETGSYVPDTQFVQDLRDFFEGQGYNFHDEDAPGAKARAKGDVFSAGVIWKTGGAPNETDGSTSVRQGKPGRPEKANLQFMRIAPELGDEQVDRVFECIEANETAIDDAAGQPVGFGFLSDSPDASTQVKAVALLRRLAENGLMYARLMGRDLIPVVKQADMDKKQKPRSSGLVFASAGPATDDSKTIGELLQAVMRDVQLAVIDGNKEAIARRKARTEPSEVLQALVG